MLCARFRCWIVLCTGLSLLQTGCLALSFGGKSQQVDTVVSESPDTKERIDKLESRVQAIEQHLPLPANVPADPGPALPQ